VTRGVSSYARLLLLVVLTVVLQVSAIVHVRALGAAPDLVPLLVAAVGFLAGPVPGAVTGFLSGFLLDLDIGRQLGAASLVLVGVGYGVGRFRELRDPGHGLIPVPIGAAATLAYLLGSAVVSLMLEVTAPLSIVLLRDALVTVLLGAVLAVPVFWVVRWVLRSALVADPFERRRRPAEPSPTGPIGLRGLEAP
jgi:rod shape-determining protein MreD